MHASRSRWIRITGVRSILADPDQLSQVLINLIMNAIHAMPEGGTLPSE